MILTALYDTKVKKYFNFITVDNIERLKREYSLMFKSGTKNALVVYPEDYILSILGEINDDTGLVVPCLTNVCQLVDLKEVKLNEKLTY